MYPRPDTCKIINILRSKQGKFLYLNLPKGCYLSSGLNEDRKPVACQWTPICPDDFVYLDLKWQQCFGINDLGRYSKQFHGCKMSFGFCPILWLVELKTVAPCL